MSGRGWLPALGLLLLFPCGCGSGGSEPPGEGDPEPASAGPAVNASGQNEGQDPTNAFEPLPQQQVKLYFPSIDAEVLVPEQAEIFQTASPVDRAKQILSDLISGPNQDYALPCLPARTRLRQVYVLENGVAYVDFTGDLTLGLGGGSSRELMAVYAIVDSLALNIPEIERVGILVDGQPIQTLNGHMDLRRPLPPNLSLVRRPEELGWEEERIVQAGLPLDDDRPE